MNAASQRGVTLVELLIALAIFGLVAAASVHALRLAVGAGEQLAEAEARIGEIEAARLILRQDLAQAALRSPRAADGAPAPAFLGGETARAGAAQKGERVLLAFVRGGWTNPDAAAPRASLQHVEYVLRDGALIRRVRAHVDATPATPVQERMLIGAVDGASVRFLVGVRDADEIWTDSWPAGPGAGAPRALALTLSDARFGAVEHRFWIGALSAGSGA